MKNRQHPHAPVQWSRGLQAAGEALRCHARTKRTGLQCKGPAVNGWKVCRMHGARGGAPSGERNGQYCHGRRTKAVLAERRELMVLLRELSRLIDECK
jgi:hypothetical protein